MSLIKIKNNSFIFNYFSLLSIILTFQIHNIALGQNEILSSVNQSISLGLNHGCFINSEQKVECWGDNQYGQLDIPTLALKKKIVNIASGHHFTCALSQDKVLYCWGAAGVKTCRYCKMPDKPVMRVSHLQSLGRNEVIYVNSKGQTKIIGEDPDYLTKRHSKLWSLLADTTKRELLLASLTDLPRYYRDIATSKGNNFGCILLENDDVICQTLVGFDEEFAIIPNIKKMTVTYNYPAFCLLNNVGKISCYKYNIVGRSGKTFENKIKLPVEVNDTKNIYLDAGEHSACSVKPDGQILCWDLQNSKLIASPTSHVFSKHLDYCQTSDHSGLSICPVGDQKRMTYETFLASLEKVKDISIGYNLTCVTFEEKGARCWRPLLNHWESRYETSDRFNFEELSIPEEIRTEKIIKIEITGGNVKTPPGNEGICALTESGELFCWGYGVDRPFAKISETNDIRDFGVSTLGICIVREKTRVLECYENPSAVNKTPSITDIPSDKGVKFDKVSMNNHNACAIYSGPSIDRSVVCWGGNHFAGNKKLMHFPDDLENVKYISSRGYGSSHCAVDDTNEVTCWGYDSDYQPATISLNSYLKLNNQTNVNSVVDLNFYLMAEKRGRDRTTYSAGGQNACVLFDDGSLQCGRKSREPFLDSILNRFTRVLEPPRNQHLNLCRFDLEKSTKTEPYLICSSPDLPTPHRSKKFKSIDMGGLRQDQVCGVTLEGKIYCWNFTR